MSIYTFPSIRLPLKIASSTEAANRVTDLKDLITKAIDTVMHANGFSNYYLTYTVADGYMPTFIDEREAFIFNLKGKAYYRDLIMKEINDRIKDSYLNDVFTFQENSQ